MDPATRLRLAVVAAGLSIVAAGVTFFGVPAADAPAPVGSDPVAGPAMITVHVSGAVLMPGLVEVASSARVADVVAAAGGSAPDAALGAVNLAAPVRDGEHVVIPGAADVDQPADGRVRLNTATESELEAIPGIGPVLAARIVAARDAQGGFDAIEDLLDVSGIGEAKLASFRDVVAVP